MSMKSVKSVERKTSVHDEHVMSIHSIHMDEHEHTRTNGSYKLV